MPKAKVMLEGGFRYYRLDNVPVDVKQGQEIELDDIPTRDRNARISAGHVTNPEGTPAPVSAPPVAASEDAKKTKK